MIVIATYDDFAIIEQPSGERFLYLESGDFEELRT